LVNTALMARLLLARRQSIDRHQHDHCQAKITRAEEYTNEKVERRFDSEANLSRMEKLDELVVWLPLQGRGWGFSNPAVHELKT
jgi:hypothetical protein